MALYKEIAPFVEEHYWDMGMREMADELDCGSSTVLRARDYAELPRKTNENELEYRYGVPAEWLLNTLHNHLDYSVNHMSEILPVSRYWITEYMSENGIPRRGQSEAELVKWDQMSDDEREKQVEAAHERIRELAKESKLGYQIWERENPEVAKKLRIEAGEMLSQIRETNGMKGVTGKDSPTWRGGYRHKDSIMMLLPGKPFYDQRKRALERDEYTCQQCGDTDEEIGRDPDVHHIIPVLCGGTNALENLISLCPVCHTTAEHYTYRFADPHLTESFGREIQYAD